MVSFQPLSILLAVVTVSFGASSGNPTQTKSEGNFELLIFHTNDIHARYDEATNDGEDCTPFFRDANKCYGGAARIANVVYEAKQKYKEGKGPPVLHLNAGDTYTGTPWHGLFRGEAASDFTNVIGIDAMSLGNHEFDDGTKELSLFIKNVTKTTPVLCANIDLSNEPELASQYNLKKSTVLTINKHKIGIIGYLTPTTKNGSSKNNVTYIDEIVALKEETKKLKKQGVNIIIALGHSGYKKDLDIAKEVEDLDIVVGGHSHTLLCNNKCPDPTDIVNKNETYPTNVRQASGRIVRVVQAKCNTKYLGQITITFNSSGEIINAIGQPLLLDATVPQNSTVLSIVEEYKRRPEFVEAMTVVGRTSVILYRDNCNIGECNIGNLATDAIVYNYANNYKGENWTDAPIAVVQYGSVRSSIKHASLPANITVFDLMTAMPYKNKLAVVTMNGTVLLKMLEQSVANYEVKSNSFLQVSGLQVVYDVSRPVGSRVVKVEARCSACQVPEYHRVEEKRLYKVISQGFIASGGDGYTMLEQSTKFGLDYTESLCTMYYIKNLNLVFPEIEGRITVLGYDKTGTR